MTFNEGEMEKALQLLSNHNGNIDAVRLASLLNFCSIMLMSFVYFCKQYRSWCRRWTGCFSEIMKLEEMLQFGLQTKFSASVMQSRGNVLFYQSILLILNGFTCLFDDAVDMAITSRKCGS